ncbi:MAG: serine hydrolase domain-containing protein [Planctomycetota bacterium]
MSRKMIYTGICLFFVFVFGLQKSPVLGEESKVKSSKPEYSSAADRAKPMLKAELVFKPSVFSNIKGSNGKEGFPSCDFVDPEKARKLLGDYKIDAKFYNKDYEVVNEPTAKGRYGAVVKITAEDSKVYTRFRTLYKTPKKLQYWWPGQIGGELKMPEGFGVDDGVWHNQRQLVNDYIANAVGRDINRSHDFAVLLAGMNEISLQDGPASQLTNVLTKDRQWWLPLKRKLNGNKERFAKEIVTPVTVEGLDAPVLRKGSEKEAGMKKGTIEKIDAVLTEWVNNSDQPFNACVARKGVVFFNQAYGVRDGEPVTTETRHVVFSITKALSGSLLMMFVDRGVIHLDHPVGKILPEFVDADVEIPVTFHHLFTHTADMDGHFTDLMNDLEHVYGEAYPYLKIGGQHRYNGTSIAVGLKALEQVTGVALPNLYQKYLFGPLGCESIESIDGSAMTWSNAYDLARVGQMLANHGSYGNLRFFSEETFEQMLPRKLDKLLGDDTKVTWGIGLTWFGGNGLSKKTIGHGSASSCTLRVDLENDLVITMTRQTAGKNFGKYHPKFIAAVTGGIKMNKKEAE